MAPSKSRGLSLSCIPPLMRPHHIRKRFISSPIPVEKCRRCTGKSIRKAQRKKLTNLSGINLGERQFTFKNLTPKKENIHSPLRNKEFPFLGSPISPRPANSFTKDFSPSSQVSIFLMRKEKPSGILRRAQWETPSGTTGLLDFKRSSSLIASSKAATSTSFER